MKNLLPTIVLTLASQGLLAQGTVTLANSTASRVINGLTGLPVPAGTSVKVALYYLADTGVTPTSADFSASGLTLGASAGFNAAGVFNAGTRSTPGPGGETAWFQVRAWETAWGATYEQALNNSTPIGGRFSLLGTSNIMRVTTGNPTIIPPTVPGSLTGAGLQSICLMGPGGPYLCVVPEPSVAGLSLMGAFLCFLVFGHKRQQP